MTPNNSSRSVASERFRSLSHYPARLVGMLKCEFVFDLTLCHSRDKRPRILMPAGSWRFPGTTVIHLDPVWVLEGLSQICNLVIANYILDAFCLIPSLPPSTSFSLTRVLKSSHPLHRPQHRPAPQHWAPEPEVAS